MKPINPIYLESTSVTVHSMNTLFYDVIVLVTMLPWEALIKKLTVRCHSFNELINGLSFAKMLTGSQIQM